MGDSPEWVSYQPCFVFPQRDTFYTGEVWHSPSWVARQFLRYAFPCYLVGQGKSKDTLLFPSLPFFPCLFFGGTPLLLKTLSFPCFFWGGTPLIFGDPPPKSTTCESQTLRTYGWITGRMSTSTKVRPLFGGAPRLPLTNPRGSLGPPAAWCPFSPFLYWGRFPY